MTDQRQETEAGSLGLDASEGREEGEFIFNVNVLPKTQEFGDGGNVSSPSSLHENLMIKTELNEGISVKTGSGRNKSLSPASKRLSKRKRKNRRRREKKAAASSTSVGIGLPQNLDEGTGTETEVSQSSEEVKKEEETGTESETTFQEETDLEQDVSFVKPSETTVASIPEENDDTLDEAHDSISSGVRNEEASGNTGGGPTHSVGKLLQIAKSKIYDQFLGSVQQCENSKMGFPRSHEENNSAKLVVPPCSPSSLHSINYVGNSSETIAWNSQDATQKTVSKNVHFDERPPEMVPLEVRPSEDTFFNMTLESVHHNVDGEGKKSTERATTVKKISSNETDVLIETVGITESVTSSIASETSAASLLKGNGSSSEDFVESNYHYPSRENVDDSSEEQHGKELSEINVDTFRESIHMFKIQNPTEAQYIGQELDSILTKSFDKFTTLMENTTGGVNDSSPVFVYGERLDGQKQRDSKDPKNPVENVSHFLVQKSPEISTKSDSKVDSSTEDLFDSPVCMNTTFVVEKVPDEYEHFSSPRPLSADEVMPQAIPDMVSDTESVITAGHLSIVPEEDEDNDELSQASNILDNDVLTNDPVKLAASLQPPSLSVSDASCCTVIEAVTSVHKEPVIPALQICQQTKSTPVSASVAISETESAYGDGNNDETSVDVILQDQEKVSINVISSASSAESSVSSPRFEDMNDNNTGGATLEAPARPSTGETFEFEQTESELEMEKEEETKAKQSVEVFTLHFPSIPEAPPSENNLDSGNGDQPYFGMPKFSDFISNVPGNNNAAIISAYHERKDWSLAGRETETDSDWLPERKNSLRQVIHEREAADVVASIEAQAREAVAGSLRAPDQSAEDGAENGNENDKEQGCNCAKMCVIA